MTDPKIIKATVTISYTSDDGLSSSTTFSDRPVSVGKIAPVQPLIDGLEELARVTTLFGHEINALTVFHEARKQVFIWRSKREKTITN
ncbi:MAG: hypothetical protein WA071_27960 [Undibacterium umbellatum]|uniref:hypothetical protein n=1 Tax=Undibacterium umbellatum TaxID=2762300 RepID=UPI003BB5B1D5